MKISKKHKFKFYWNVFRIMINYFKSRGGLKLNWRITEVSIPVLTITPLILDINNS